MSEVPIYLIEQLNPSRHKRETFYCESSELTDFLQKRARKEMDSLTSACFVLVDVDKPSDIAGYYTLSQTSITVDSLPEGLRKRLPRYPEIGATLIGRLARDSKWRGKGIGNLLLIDALRRSHRLSSEAGAVVVVTDPKDARAKQFYSEFGFLELDNRRLFLPIKDIPNQLKKIR